MYTQPSKRNMKRNITNFNSGYFLVLGFKVKYSSLQLSLFFNINLCYFLKNIHLFVYLVYTYVCLWVCVCMCVCMHEFMLRNFCAYYGTQMGLRGQFRGVSSSTIRVPGLNSRCPTWQQVPLPTGPSQQPCVFKVRTNHLKRLVSLVTILPLLPLSLRCQSKLEALKYCLQLPQLGTSSTPCSQPLPAPSE